MYKKVRKSERLCGRKISVAIDYIIKRIRRLLNYLNPNGYIAN